MTTAAAHTQRWRKALTRTTRRVGQLPNYRRSGRVVRATGMVIEVVGLQVAVGSACRIELPGADGRLGESAHHAEAEVVGFSGDKLFLMPLEEISGLMPGARVSPLVDGVGHSARRFPVGEELLGRVLDGNGNPLDDREGIDEVPRATLHTAPLNPLSRAPIDTPIDVGIRAINALLSVGKGQRMGLFAGSGVGKSVLLGMMARYTQADVIVVGLIGERGREVQDFIDNILGPEGRRRSVVVAAPADTSPLQRLQGAAYATRLAEGFRDSGRNVLLIMDSLTRYAMAQR
ncbi:flagellum-specific ATP synthase FliI, partial [Halomonas sp. 707D7]|nr:flagellum-specific ATP synthase FliI [Halomonas sp. 707D7]